MKYAMNNTFSKFLEILANNDFVPNLREIPDDFDDRDELLAELDEMDTLPDSLRYFELNGFSNSIELKKCLEKYFKQFKIDFLSGDYYRNSILIKEIENQLDVIKNDITKTANQANQLKDIELNNLISIKTHYCDELKEFIKNYQNSKVEFQVDKADRKNKKKEIVSYKWLIGQDKLQEFYNKMIANKLIAQDTQEDDFKAVFSAIPVSDIKNRIQWEKGAKLFAYFFNELTEHDYIPKKPKWILLEYCFNYKDYRNSTYVPILESVKSHMTEISIYGAPKEANLVDCLFLTNTEQTN